MTTHRVSATAGVSLLAIVLVGGAALPAQTQTPPVPPPPVERFELPSQPRRPSPPDQEQVPEQIREYRRPVVRLFQNFTLPAGEATREVISVLADVRIEGTVARDVAVTLGSATLASTAVIEGSLVVVGGSATVAQGARVAGDLVVIGGTLEASPDFTPGGEHVVVGTPVIGDSLRALAPWLTRGLLLGRLIVPGLSWVWTIVAITFLFGLVFNHVFARQVGACADTLVKRPVGAFVVGLLVILLSGPVLLIVAATVIGLPFAVAAVIAANVIGRLAVTRVIGRSIVSESEPENRGQSFRSYLIGAAVVILAYMVPILGLLTWALIGVFGVGTATMTFMASLKRERPETPPAPVTPPVAPPGPSAGPPSFVASEAGVPPAAGVASLLASEPAPAAYAAPVASPEPPSAPRVEPPPFAGGVAYPPAGAGGTADLLRYPRASFLDRMAAFALDAVLVAIANAMLESVSVNIIRHDGGPYFAMLLVYHVAFWAWKGTTLGGIICNLRMVRTTGEDPRFIDALVRGLSAIFSVAALFIGCLWMLNDPERQMWHDKIAGTVVLKMPRELVLA